MADTESKSGFSRLTEDDQKDAECGHVVDPSSKGGIQDDAVARMERRDNLLRIFIGGMTLAMAGTALATASEYTFGNLHDTEVNAPKATMLACALGMFGAQRLCSGISTGIAKLGNCARAGIFALGSAAPVAVGAATYGLSRLNHVDSPARARDLGIFSGAVGTVLAEAAIQYVNWTYRK